LLNLDKAYLSNKNNIKSILNEFSLSIIAFL